MKSFLDERHHIFLCEKSVRQRRPYMELILGFSLDRNSFQALAKELGDERRFQELVQFEWKPIWDDFREIFLEACKIELGHKNAEEVEKFAKVAREVLSLAE